MLQVNIHEPKASLSSLIQKVVKDEDVYTSQTNHSLSVSITIDDEIQNRELGRDNRISKVSNDFEDYNK